MRPQEARVPSKLVYITASTMICVGLTAWMVAAMGGSTAEESDASRRNFDLSTPAGTAEAFLDAWRRRDHEAAALLATGIQLERVAQRMARDSQATSQERALKAQAWDAMAEDPLHFRIHTSGDIDHGRALVLEGTAEGRFLGDRYVREIRFMMVEENDAWRVHEMELGTILESGGTEDPLQATEEAR